MRRRWWWMRRPVAAGLSSESAQDDLLDGPTEVVVDGVEDRVDGWIEISHPVAEFDVPSGEKVRHKRWDLQSVPTTHSFNILPTLVSSSTLSLSTITWHLWHPFPFSNFLSLSLSLSLPPISNSIFFFKLIYELIQFWNTSGDSDCGMALAQLKDRLPKWDHSYQHVGVERDPADEEEEDEDAQRVEGLLVLAGSRVLRFILHGCRHKFRLLGLVGRLHRRAHFARHLPFIPFRFWVVRSTVRSIIHVSYSLSQRPNPTHPLIPFIYVLFGRILRIGRLNDDQETHRPSLKLVYWYIDWKGRICSEIVTRELSSPDRWSLSWG